MTKLFCAALIALLAACLPRSGATPEVNKLAYHNDPQRSGWNAHERILTPEAVSGPEFGLIWRSEPFDTADGMPPRLFATPLYVDRVEIAAGPHQGKTLSVLYAVASTGHAYAVNAFDAEGVRAGAILWRVTLADDPCDRGMMGNLATPVIDLRKQRLYVTSCDNAAQWRAHSLDLASGAEATDWPVTLDRAALHADGVRKNGPVDYPEERAKRQRERAKLQRGALNLSPDGLHLYAVFAEGPGWLVSIDTEKATVASAFTSTARTEERQGGLWASSGPSVDSEGRVHMPTGSSSEVVFMQLGLPGVFVDSPHSWGQSVIQLSDDPQTGLELIGTYTPFNYCRAALHDIDLGSSGAVAIDLDPKTTSTPQLLAFGGKQGNAYLLDRANMPGDLVKRQPCSEDPTTDTSLLSPEPQPHFGALGPINVFGPYSDEHGMNDHARSRATPAYFRASDGTHYVFVTGSTKKTEASKISVPPGLARLRIVSESAQPAHLEIDQLEMTQSFLNPGSPVVTSNGGEDAIVWVLDENAPRTAPLYGPQDPEPVLYAFDALTLRLLWKSEPGALGPSGKYNEPTVVRGVAFVGTNRIEAFGLGRKRAGAKAPDEVLPDPLVALAPGGPQVSREALASARAYGERLFDARCASCHSDDVPGVPPRATIAALGTVNVLVSLTNGVMRPQAEGLSNEEMQAIAIYLTFPPPAPAD